MSVLAELKRRNVFRVGVAYLVTAWVLLQIADVVFPALNLPAWSLTLITLLLAAGLVPVLILAWVYELTPEGVKREAEVDRSKSITGDTGRKLNIVTIVMIVIAASLLLADRFVLGVPDGRRLSGDDGDVPTIAVLPFAATGSDDGGLLAAGLHDELLTKLARLGAFRVISRTSMMEYADRTKNMRQIGEELGAGYILEGSVQAVGERVRINAQLIDAPKDEHIWADTYDTKLTATNLFEVQGELSIAIAEEMQVTLTDADREFVSRYRQVE